MKRTTLQPILYPVLESHITNPRPSVLDTEAGQMWEIKKLLELIFPAEEWEWSPGLRIRRTGDMRKRVFVIDGVRYFGVESAARVLLEKEKQ
jgi:hypothetical protein